MGQMGQANQMGQMGQANQMGQMGQGDQRPLRPDAEIFIEFDVTADLPSYFQNLLCCCLKARLRVAKFSYECSYQPTDVILLTHWNNQQAPSNRVMLMEENNEEQVLAFLGRFFN